MRFFLEVILRLHMVLHVADGKILNQVMKSIPSIPQTHHKSICADVLMNTDSVWVYFKSHSHKWQPFYWFEKEHKQASHLKWTEARRLGLLF